MVPDNALQDRLIRTLTKLIQFCTKSEQTDPLLREGTPIVEHQRLLLEQNIHICCFRVLVEPFQPQMGNRVSLFSLAHDHPRLHHICKLCYRLLKQMVKGAESHALLFTKQDVQVCAAFYPRERRVSCAGSRAGRVKGRQAVLVEREAEADTGLWLMVGEIGYQPPQSMRLLNKHHCTL